MRPSRGAVGHRRWKFTLLLLCVAATLTACTAGRDPVANSGSDPLDDTGGGDGRTLYVDPDGDDAGVGTAEDPFATINHAMSLTEPGDTVQVRDGLYHEQVTLRRSGTDDAPITLQNEPGEHPIIDGTGLDVGRGFSALVTIDNVSNVRVSGFEIRNFVSIEGRRNPVGMFVRGGGSNIAITDNDIHHIEARATTGDRDAHGIAVYGTSETALTEITIHHNRVHDLVLGTSESVVVNGNVDGFAVTANEIFDNDNIGIDVIGFEGKSPTADLDRARNGVVADNLVYRIDTITNPSYFERNAAGIYVDGGADVLIEGNIVVDSNMGIEIASEHANGATSRINVRNNLLFRNHNVGLALGGYDRQRGSTDGCVVTNNTVVDNDTDHTGGGELWLQFDVVDNVISGNVFVAGSPGLLMSNPYVENRGNTLDGNLWYATDPTWEWMTDAYLDWSDYRNSTGNDADSVFIDPEFADLASVDLTVTASGAPRDVGADASVLARLPAVVLGSN